MCTVNLHLLDPFHPSKKKRKSQTAGFFASWSLSALCQLSHLFSFLPTLHPSLHFFPMNNCSLLETRFDRSKFRLFFIKDSGMVFLIVRVKAACREPRLKVHDEQGFSCTLDNKGENGKAFAATASHCCMTHILSSLAWLFGEGYSEFYWCLLRTERHLFLCISNQVTSTPPLFCRLCCLFVSLLDSSAFLRPLN